MKVLVQRPKSKTGRSRRNRRSRGFLAHCALFSGVCWIAALAAAPAWSQGGSLGHLQIVAHADDDLYFMNPAVAKSIEAGEPTWTIFLTAGDAGGPPSYWPTREDGIRAAYAEMAGQPNVWDSFQLPIEGRNLTAVALSGTVEVVLVFMRLPDGSFDGSGNLTTGFESLQQLWEDPVAGLIHTVDGAHQYTRSELIDSLAAIVQYRGPSLLRVQDPTGYHGDDHSDHVHGGRFAFEAHLRLSTEHRLEAYRAYNIDQLPINLSPAERMLTADIQSIYQSFDLGAVPNAWNDREFALGELKETRASIGWNDIGMPNTCLGIQDHGLPSAALAFESCAGTAEQIFRISERRIRFESDCVVSPAPLGAPGSIGWEACDSTSVDQGWVLFTDGHIRVAGNRCLGEVGGNPGLTACTAASRLWEIRAQPTFPPGPPAAPGGSADFSATEFAGDAARFGSLTFGDVNGDHYEDACARRADGLYCALADENAQMATATLWSPDFEDAAGWSALTWSTTLSLADVDGDGRADACGRTSAGIECALSLGTVETSGPSAIASFGPLTLWTTEFSDADGGEIPKTNASLRFEDITGDGLADLCARRAGGVDCLVSDGAQLGAASTWIGAPWEAGLALDPMQNGRGMMLGDLDGDGDADLCERGADGVHCAESEPGLAQFRRPSLRAPGEFDDAAGWDTDVSRWGSIRLADLTGDGRADLCGRDVAGIRCVFSINGRFSLPSQIVSESFGDSNGYGTEERGATIAFADLDGDGRMGLCGIGPDALACARLAAPLVLPEPSLTALAVFGATGLMLGVARRRGTHPSRPSPLG